MENIFYDFNTSNKSFLDVSKKLKEKGVKNNKFMLALYDKDLINVDPFDKSISLEIRQKIINECKRNIWYYFREVLKIKAQGGGQVRFELDLASCTSIYLASLEMSNWVNKPRQRFNTGTSLSIIHYMDLFGNKFKFKRIDKIHRRDMFEDLPFCENLSPLKKYDENSDNDLTIAFYDDAEFNDYIETIYNKNSLNLFSSVVSNRENVEKFLNKSSVKFVVEYFDLSVDCLKEIYNSRDFFYVIYSLEDLGLGEKYLQYNATVLNISDNKDIFIREILQRRKVEDLTKEEIEWIENFIKSHTYD